MKHNEMTKEVLKVNKNSFKVLHNIFGFDFEKDFTIVKHYGKFTINGLMKIANTDNFVIVFKSNKYNCFSELTLAEVKNGNINIEFSTGRVFNNPYAKNRFEELRKEATETYIIMQDAEKKSEPTAEKNCNGAPMEYNKTPFNLEDRFIKKGRELWQNNRRLTGSYKLSHRKFDKSGYLVDTKHEKLRIKANQLRAERSKAKAQTIDLSADIEAMQTVYNEKKSAVIEAIQNDSFSSFYSTIAGLSSAYDDLKRIIEKNDKKAFSSVEDIERNKNWFYKSIDRVIV